MKLYTNAASPFGRKCRVNARELDIKLEEVNTMPFQDANFRKVNPLGKIPALVLGDGSVLIDSPVICEYLDEAYPESSLLGRTLAERIEVRRLADV